MIQGDDPRIDPDYLELQIDGLLSKLGTGQVASVAYDTAWVARLAPHFPQNDFDLALPWLRRHQHPDGSWGSDAFHYHDRLICTLAAITTLKIIRDQAGDEVRMQRGLDFLWRNTGQLFADANPTESFEPLVAFQFDDARRVGLDLPEPLSWTAEPASDPDQWRNRPRFRSAEVFRIGLPAGAAYLANDGSIGGSPAATASLLLHSERGAPQSSRALNYLNGVIQEDGGAPAFAPIDTGEITWALAHLRSVDAITADSPLVKAGLDVLWRAWSPQQGLGMVSTLAVPDLKTTSLAFGLLRWGGYPVSAEVFQRYEATDHFRYWSTGTDQSLGAQIHMLAALPSGQPRAEAWATMIRAWLRRWNHEHGWRWFDAWHTSPYYLASIAVQALHGAGHDLSLPFVKWIGKSQQDDGGWGYGETSTPEETAYCLLALLDWNRTVEPVEELRLRRAANYLYLHLTDQRFVPQWIGKCLYAPVQVVRAAILAALFGYATHA